MEYLSNLVLRRAASPTILFVKNFVRAGGMNRIYCFSIYPSKYNEYTFFFLHKFFCCRTMRLENYGERWLSKLSNESIFMVQILHFFCRYEENPNRPIPYHNNYHIYFRMQYLWIKWIYSHSTWMCKYCSFCVPSNDVDWIPQIYSQKCWLISANWAKV